MNDILRSVQTDIRYALRQLRNLGVIGAAIDALERAEKNLDGFSADAIIDELGKILAGGADDCRVVERSECDATP